MPKTLKAFTTCPAKLDWYSGSIGRGISIDPAGALSNMLLTQLNTPLHAAQSKYGPLKA
jgi:hypothetical protein